MGISRGHSQERSASTHTPTEVSRTIPLGSMSDALQVTPLGLKAEGADFFLEVGPAC